MNRTMTTLTLVLKKRKLATVADGGLDTKTTIDIPVEVNGTTNKESIWLRPTQ
jgi:hypothetical protein